LGIAKKKEIVVLQNVMQEIAPTLKNYTLLGSISPMFYEQLLYVRIPRAKKTLKT